MDTQRLLPIKRLPLLSFILLISTQLSFSQLFSESFDEANAATTGISNEGNTVSWSSSTTNCTLSGSDHFEVQSNLFEAQGFSGCTAPYATWTTANIDVSGEDAVDISIDVVLNNECETSDFIELQYQLDAGGFILIERVLGNAPSAVSQTISLGGLDVSAANTLVLQARVKNSANPEIITFDNVLVERTVTKVSFVAATAEANEDAGIVNSIICVSISNPDAVNPTTTDLVLTGGTATNGSDITSYTTQNLNFPAGSSANQCISITITDDGDQEGNETLIFSLQNVMGGNAAAIGIPGSMTFTILDNDVPDIMINEVMYNSPSTDDEWVELFNNDVTIDISNYTFEINGSTEITFPAVTSFPASGFLRLAVGSNGDGTFNNDNPFTPDFNSLGVANAAVATTSNTNNLSNSSDVTLTLKTAGGVIVDEITFSQNAPWPGGNANGTGSTIELNNPTLDNNVGTNWSASASNGGTPGSNNTAFPIELVRFDVAIHSTSVQLSWQTASEFNNDFFSILHSTDGYDFEEIAQIKGAGNSTEFLTYNYLHVNPTSGRNYYQLQQHDFDGSTSQSDIMAIQLPKKGASLRNNLTSTELFLQLEKAAESDLEITILNTSNAIVEKVMLPAGNTDLRVDIQHLPSGFYFLQLPTSLASRLERFVKI